MTDFAVNHLTSQLEAKRRVLSSTEDEIARLQKRQVETAREIAELEEAIGRLRQ